MSPVFAPRCVFAVMAASGLVAGCATIYPESPPDSPPGATAGPPELQVRGLQPPLGVRQEV